MTIVIVDDHGDWRDTIAEFIHDLGLGEAILTAGSLSELDQLLLSVTPGILVLDAMLPDGDGLARVSHLRTTYPSMGIIMLTGRLLSEDKVSGLSLGAGVNWQSALTNSISKVRRPSYSVWNARVAYDLTSHWTAALNVNNLFDKVYYEYPGYVENRNNYGAPRSVLLTLRGRF